MADEGKKGQKEGNGRIHMGLCALGQWSHKGLLYIRKWLHHEDMASKKLRLTFISSTSVAEYDVK